MALTPSPSGTFNQTIANTAAVLTAASIPSGTTAVKISVYSNPLRYTRDGTTPTTVIGEYATDKGRIVLWTAAEVAAAQFIREGGSSAVITVEPLIGVGTADDFAQLANWLLGAGAVSAGNNIAGIAAGYKVARGQATTVAASDTVVTGLTTVVAVVATLDSDPVAGCQFASASIGDQAGTPAAGSILVKTWKATAAGDTAVIAATTFTKKVNWVAIGSMLLLALSSAALSLAPLAVAA